MIVDAYVETGEPVGSRTLSRRGRLDLSPATIRNVMADLEEAGLLFAPHTSAGRLPTERGAAALRQRPAGARRPRRGRAPAASTAAAPPPARACRRRSRRRRATLSGLSRCAGLVVAPKTERPLKHIEFVPLGPGPRAGRDGHRGRAGREPADRGAARHCRPRRWSAAGNYLNARLVRPHHRGGARPRSSPRSSSSRAQLDELTAEAGRGRARVLGRRRRAAAR